MKVVLNHVLVVDDVPDPFDMILVQVLVGSDEYPDGGESFQIEVCSPLWLERELMRTPIVPGTHRLFVRQWDLDVVTRLVEEHIGRATGETWEESVASLRLLGLWEFEGYRDEA